MCRQPVMGKSLTFLPTEVPLATCLLICPSEIATKRRHLGLEMGSLGLCEKRNKLGHKGVMLVAVYICMSVQLRTNTLLLCDSR